MDHKKHTIIIYNFSKNAIHQPFKDILEDHVITSTTKDTGNVAYHMIINTAMSKSYKIKLYGDLSNGIEMSEIPTSDVNKKSFLQFINDVIKEDPADNYTLVLNGNGAGHYFFCENSEITKGIFIQDIANWIRELNIHFELIVLNGNYMASLETIYELKDLTHYIIASENKCAYDGFCSGHTIETYRESPDYLTICSNIIQSTERIMENTYGYDVALIDVSYIDAYLLTLRKPSNILSGMITDPDFDIGYRDLQTSNDYDVSPLVKIYKQFGTVSNQEYHGLSYNMLFKNDEFGSSNYSSVAIAKILSWIGKEVLPQEPSIVKSTYTSEKDTKDVIEEKHAETKIIIPITKIEKPGRKRILEQLEALKGKQQKQVEVPVCATTIISKSSTKKKRTHARIMLTTQKLVTK